MTSLDQSRDHARAAAVTPRHVARLANVVEQLLDFLGAESPLANDIIGDLAEEYAARRERDGTARARWWYAREATRAMPHLLRDAVRHGTPEGRANLLTMMAGTALASVLVVIAVRMHVGAPAQMLQGLEGTPDRVVVSTLHPVKIPLRVLDARGHLLPDSAVRYAWEAGGAARVSHDGVAQCVKRGHTIARASLGELVTRVRLDCQPVAKLRMMPWYNMLVGDDAHELRLGGIGIDGRPVTRLAAVASIDDPRIATLEGKRVRPHAPGRTFVEVSVGEEWVRAAITVFEPVRTLVGLRPDQRYVLAPVHLAPGQSVRWPLAEGRVWLVNQVDDIGDAPTMEVSGPATCEPALAVGVYRTRCRIDGPGASVTLSWPAAATRAIDGELAVEREVVPKPFVPPSSGSGDPRVPVAP